MGDRREADFSIVGLKMVLAVSYIPLLMAAPRIEPGLAPLRP